MFSFVFFAAMVAVFVLSFVQPAAAYVGPGMGLSAIGSILALVVAIIVAIFGFVWYPVKRMMKRRKKNNDTEE